VGGEGESGDRSEMGGWWVVGVNGVVWGCGSCGGGRGGGRRILGGGRGKVGVRECSPPPRGMPSSKNHLE